MEALKNQELGQIFKYMKNCFRELDANKDDLKRYIIEDPRGREVFGYFGNLVDSAVEYGTENKDRFENIDRALSYVAKKNRLIVFLRSVNPARVHPDLGFIIAKCL